MAQAERDNPSGFERFLVIDDHPLFCEALTMTLRNVVDVSEVTSAHSLGEAMKLIAEGFDPDTILLDLNLPDVNSIDGLMQLRDALPATPVVVISSLNDNRIITRVMNAGAVGFIPKDTDGAELERAFKRIRGGESYTPATFSTAEAVVADVEPGDDAVDYLQSLTPQQRRILDLVCEGMLNKQIAYELGIAETTVKAHITAILRKLHVQNRTQAVLIAQRAQLDNALPRSETFT